MWLALLHQGKLLASRLRVPAPSLELLLQSPCTFLTGFTSPVPLAPCLSPSILTEGSHSSHWIIAEYFSFLNNFDFQLSMTHTGPWASFASSHSGSLMQWSTNVISRQLLGWALLPPSESLKRETRHKGLLIFHFVSNFDKDTLSANPNF